MQYNAKVTHSLKSYTQNTKHQLKYHSTEVSSQGIMSKNERLFKSKKKIEKMKKNTSKNQTEKTPIKSENVLCITFPGTVYLSSRAIHWQRTSTAAQNFPHCNKDSLQPAGDSILQYQQINTLVFSKILFHFFPFSLPSLLASMLRLLSF